MDESDDSAEENVDVTGDVDVNQSHDSPPPQPKKLIGDKWTLGLTENKAPPPVTLTHQHTPEMTFHGLSSAARMVFPDKSEPLCLGECWFRFLVHMI